MEEEEAQNDQNCENSVNIKDDKSSENFQKFIYELFEKNGVLSDLRAYLRGHIVNVFKNVNTGETPMCQKHFAQRLELTYQALNILVAEYLMRLDFTYSLSVFISEIPLANMVFDLANSLLQTKTDDDYKELRFKDSDVWCVLNYLGIKCDSETASNIVYMYKEEAKLPLILCILKCLPIFQKQSGTFECVNTSEASVSGSSKVSVDSYLKGLGKKSNSLTICKHYAFCDSCKQRMARIQRKYKYKKEALCKDSKSNDMFKPEGFFKNIDVLERDIIEEMFSQLRTVYETEVEMVREEEERKIKRSLANHALILQKRYDEMKESFKAREVELESNVEEKKKFLWGLARALRDQHSNMSVAMDTVQMETERLNNKEETLQNQIKEAEHTLRKRGEEMRNQITNEMIQLESRLHSMRIERDAIERERSELEKLKEICDSNTKINLQNIKERDELNSQYNLLRTELSSLKAFSTKCLVETGVMTDTAMNNQQDIERVRSEDAIRKPNQLVNDLKKLKNVNFIQSNVEDVDHGRSFVLDSAERGRQLESLLRQENDRLKAFAEQQREHIDELAREQVRLRAELVSARLGAPRPRTAPPLMPAHGVNPSGARGACGLRRGAGEELSVFAQPRPQLPTDPIPFLGTLPRANHPHPHTHPHTRADRHADTRRYMISEWRGMRLEPPAPPAPQPGSSTQHITEEMSVRQTEPQAAEQSCASFIHLTDDRDSDQQPPEIVIEGKRREKSPKSVLREAKQKLRNKDIKKQEANTSREKSPNSMLREAKLRLRKLEIEAEAVEKSYLDFKRRRNELRREDKFVEESVPVVKESGHLFSVGQPSPVQKHNDVNRNNVDIKVTKDLLHNDFDKYLREYQNKEIMKPHFANKTTTAVKIKPIPIAYKMTDERENTQNVDYINTPLNEFRKLYHNEKPRRDKDLNLINVSSKNILPQNIKGESLENIENTELILNVEKPTTEEINNLNINETYGFSNDDIPCRDEINSRNKEVNKEEMENKSLLKVELENLIETASVKTNEGDLMVVIETSIASEMTISNNSDSITPVSVVVTPTYESDRSKNSKSSISIKSPLKLKETPEKAARLTRKDVLNAIFDLEGKELSSADKDDSKDGLDSIVADSEVKDGDDFLADVDNYNSRSDLGNSPISHAKTSDDDIFWD